MGFHCPNSGHSSKNTFEFMLNRARSTLDMQVALAEVLGERASIRIYFLSGNDMGWRVEGPEFDSGQNLFPSFSVALSRRVPPTDLRNW